MRASRFAVLLASTALSFVAMAQSPYDPPAPAPSSVDNYSSDSSNQASSNQVSYNQASYNQASYNQADPPTRVARLAFASGEVSYAPAGEDDWVQAQLNRPLVSGDKLWTDAGSRAELDIGASTVLLDQRTSFDFLNLNDQTAQVQLTQGAVNIAVRRTRNGETYEVDTPTLAFVADRIGDYRIAVDARTNTTTVTARRGGGEIYGEGGARVTINEGQSLSFDNPQLREPRAASISTGGDFDNFIAARDQRYERAQSRNYVSEDAVGYQDLDEYGSWSDAPDYGHVWYPNGVAADWAPYRDGRWTWVEPWGWTWVDDAPWGFAPFHYGRWVNVESRWGWLPGPVDVRPIYAPALVAFVGGGFGVGVSVGAPIGWFPLGPRDVYFPGYRCGRDYFARINVSNARINYATANNYYGGFARGNINYAQVNYAYRNRPGAITAVSASRFSSGRPVAGAMLPMNRANLANARIMPRAAIAPTRASVLAANANAVRQAPPAGALNRAVVAAQTPPPAPASFAARQRVLQSAPGQPLSTTQLRSLAAQQAQRGPQTRTVANMHGNAPVRVMPERNASANAQNRATMHAPLNTAQGRGNDPTALHANRGGMSPNEQATHARSSGYAHTQSGRQAAPPLHAQATAQQHADAHTRVQRANGAPAQTSRSSQFAHAANPRDNRAVATPQSPRHAPQAERATSPRAENHVAMPQHAPAPQYQRQIEHGALPRGENRAVSVQRQRPTERGAPLHGEPQIAARAPPQHAPMAGFQKQERATAAQPAPRAESRPAPQRVNTPPVNQPRSVPAPQQYAARKEARGAQNQNKDKDDNGRH